MWGSVKFCFGCIIGRKVLDLVNEHFESAKVEHGFLLSSIEEFLPGVRISFTHIREYKEYFIEVV